MRNMYLSITFQQYNTNTHSKPKRKSNVNKNMNSLVNKKYSLVNKNVIRETPETPTLQMDRMERPHSNTTIPCTNTLHPIPRSLSLHILRPNRHIPIHRLTYQPTIPSPTTRRNSSPRLKLDVPHKVHSRSAPKKGTNQTQTTTPKTSKSTVQID